MRSVVLVAIMTWLAGVPLWGQGPSGGSSSLSWFKGNTHTHTLNSDGDSTPDEVVRWYRERGYHFLVVTDHNLVTPVDGLNAVFAFEGRFLVIPGEEISDVVPSGAGEDAPGIPVHVNALGTRTAILPAGGATVAEALQRDVAAVEAAGVPVQINHPNFGWAIAQADLPPSSRPLLLEIFNGHPQVNNLGGNGTLPAEELWDVWLSAGRKVFGVASDDTHHLKRPWDRRAASPGRGWVVVRAATLSADTILGALGRGEFYASTGVELADWQVSPEGVSVAIATRPDDLTRFCIEFIGKGGRVLRQTDGSDASYQFTGDEGYVRVRVTDSNGQRAWTQPYFLFSRASAR